MDRKYSPINRILEETADIVRRCKTTARNVEPAEGYKRKQIQRLKEFATTNDLWINLYMLSLTFLSKGGENEVFDAVPNNVLYGIDNKLYFIDTQIRLM